MSRARTPLLALVALAIAGSPASAQIYVWRDAAGTMVLSDKPRADGGPVQTFAVERARTPVRATRPPDRRSARFDPLIDEHASAHGVDADLVRAVIQVESAFNPLAVSHKGAMGLMQLMPATATEFGVVNPFDPAENIGGGVRYLKRLLTRYDQKVELALAAYNAGPGAVDRYGQRVPPYRETRDYVRKITKGQPPAAAPPRPPTRIYRWVEVVDGREIVRYSDRPQPGPPADPPSPGSR
jgi:soluble lytic murein transglycosylase-like protein